MKSIKNTNKQWKEINKSVLNLKVKIDFIKKTQTQGNLKRKFRKQNKDLRGKLYQLNTRDSKRSLTTEDTVGEMDT
jgi:hypothetical protein